MWIKEYTCVICNKKYKDSENMQDCDTVFCYNCREMEDDPKMRIFKGTKLSIWLKLYHCRTQKCLEQSLERLERYPDYWKDKPNYEWTIALIKKRLKNRRLL